jgi:starvation-inducible DNA-binding protein
MATVTKKAKAREFSTRIDIPAPSRSTVVELLNQQLADTFDLYSQVKQAHWNVKGKDFWQLHELFDAVAETVFPWADELAERATALGGYATGTVRMSAENSRLPELPTNLTDGTEYLKAVIERVASYAETVRQAIDGAEQAEDMSSADLFTEISREVDKQLYFLEAHLQG